MRIVHENNALAFDQVTNRIELELHAEVANGLRRLDEGPANIVVADQRLAVRDSRFGRIPERRGDTGIRNGHDYVRVGRVFLREQPAQHLARLRYGAAEDDGVRT